MSLRLYFAEDSIDQDVVGPLRLRGVDVETAAEATMLERSDEEQLTYATSKQRAVVTSNAADFARLHWQYLDSGQPHTGIIVVPQQR